MSTHQPDSVDSHYLTTTAQARGWTLTWSSDTILIMTCTSWRVEAHFLADGAFRFALATGPGAPAGQLNVRTTLDLLEVHGAPLPPGAPQS